MVYAAFVSLSRCGVDGSVAPDIIISSEVLPLGLCDVGRRQEDCWPRCRATRKGRKSHNRAALRVGSRLPPDASLMTAQGPC